MEKLSVADFAEFYRAIYGYPPFPWQQHLAELAAQRKWPQVIDLPTASGKTAAIDVAVFTMALHESGPRRIFFVVDRRVVVDAAFDRMAELRRKLAEASDGILLQVAERLRRMASGGPAIPNTDPLRAVQLRGGIYRDPDWAGDPLQPTLIASTVDQVGSRLLFRGYGVSGSVAPMHAAMVGYDSLLILDEAHYSQPFVRLLSDLERIREQEPSRGLPPRLQVVTMTATPPEGGAKPFRLHPEQDYSNDLLRQRLHASKRASFQVSKARLQDDRLFARDLIQSARNMAAGGLKRIAVMVNRVQLARLIWDALANQEGDQPCDAHLLIGRMRPIDRLRLPDRITAMLSGRERTADDPVTFVVATQCLEVGADLDFDALVTECASMEALQQRFGRLDRIGDLSKSGREARAAIWIRTPMTDLKYDDPVYGSALTETWNWLKTIGDQVNFAVESTDGETVRSRFLGLASAERRKLMRRATPSPHLLPKHVDLLAQTAPQPAVSPDPSLFLHGEQEPSGDVQVVWRSDLGDNAEVWPDIVALCPPVPSEAMPVPIRVFAAWWQERPIDSTDLETVDAAFDEQANSRQAPQRRAVRWRGDESEVIHSSKVELRPGDLFILHAKNREEFDGEANALGHVPSKAPIDCAEAARTSLRRSFILRLHSKLIEAWPGAAESKAKLKALVQSQAPTVREVVSALNEYSNRLPEEKRDQVPFGALCPRRLTLQPYPDDAGWILSAKRSDDSEAGADERSAGPPVTLVQHLRDVVACTEQAAKSLLPTCPDLQLSLQAAARYHDLGKADPRFQALLHDNRFAAMALPPLAKGSVQRLSRKARAARWQRSGLPDRFRHELATLELLDGHDIDELTLHLIASHHGYCRPMAPVVVDPSPPAFRILDRGITSEQRRERASHRLDRGVARRFWRLTRAYGWWGLAYLETILRTADWRASAMENDYFERSADKEPQA